MYITIEKQTNKDFTLPAVPQPVPVTADELQNSSSRTVEAQACYGTYAPI